MSGIPWAGLLAIAAMFALPLLPAWVFEGPSKVKHRPSRHVCDDCGQPWTRGHLCEPGPFPPSLRGELTRPGRALVRREEGR